jgi:3-hydroxyacyl-CoA dehydrogenase
LNIYKIEKAAVIGAGTMGSGIAGQLANAGVEVLLLDLPGTGEQRNAPAERALERLMNPNQPGLLHRDYLTRISIGNIEDDMHRLVDVDWITEAVIERLDVKKTLYKQIDKIRKPGSMVTSNTSTIPISLLTEDMPLSFRQDFAITHYFNPVRVMRLCELVSGADTLPDVIDCLKQFNQSRMGKGIVVCKDTPGFLGNRVGVFAIQTALHAAFNLGLCPEQADAIFGRPMGVPKTGVFGLYDLIGIDLMGDVVKSLEGILPGADAFHEVCEEIPLMVRMIAEGYLGNKGGKGGFYRYRDATDSTSRQTLDFDRFTYRDYDRDKPAIALDAELSGDFTLLLENDDNLGQFAWQVLSDTLCYAALLVPEVNESLVAIDDAMKLGFNWQHGPFEMMDAIGADKMISRLEAENRDVPPFLKLATGRSFYRLAEGSLQFLKADGHYQALVRTDGIRRFGEEKKTRIAILENNSASYFDLGQGVGLLEFHSKANTLNADSMQLLRAAVEHACANLKGLVIHNDAAHFSCGVNIGGILDFIESADWVGLDGFLDDFQQTLMTMKYSPIPVVAAPAGLSIGGGFEVLLHTDKIIYHANSVTGLVESQLGLVPGGGGVKEMLYRWFKNKGDEKKAAWQTFMGVGYARTAKSPLEAEPLMMFRKGVDEYVMNSDHLLDTAIDAVLTLSADYQAPPDAQPFKMPGREVWAEMQDWLKKTQEKAYLTAHDVTTGKQIAMIVTGGDVDAGTLMTENEICALERKAFVSLGQTEQTKARVQFMLAYGSALRN